MPEFEFLIFRQSLMSIELNYRLRTWNTLEVQTGSQSKELYFSTVHGDTPFGVLEWGNLTKFCVIDLTRFL